MSRFGGRWVALGASVLLGVTGVAGGWLTPGIAGAAEIPVAAALADGAEDSLRDVLETEINEGDVVVLEAGATYELDDCEAGDIDAAPVGFTIEGNGATILQTCTDRVLELDSEVTLRNLTITGGRAGGSGGGILTLEDLTLEGVTLTGNQTTGDGGAIDTSGDLLVRNSTITANKAGEDGGAIDQSDDTQGHVFINTTIAGNCSEGAGGATSSETETDWTFVNSTVVGNTSFQNGAIDITSGEASQLFLVYTDVVGNIHDDEADCGLTIITDSTVGPKAQADHDDDIDSSDATHAANIEMDDSTLHAFGSIVADPAGGVNCDIDAGSTTESSGYNYEEGSDTCGFDDATDKVNAVDPQLGVLASNGGPTQTLLPSATSPLLNAIPLASCATGDTLAEFAITTDQRLLPRPSGTGCEIGSVEIQALVVAVPVVVITPAFTG